MMIATTYPIIEHLMVNALTWVIQLRECLLEETEVLRLSQGIERIDEIANQKKQLVAPLELFNSQCAEILNTENLACSHDGITAYFQIAKIAGFNTEILVEKWAQIRVLCVECQALNEQNGAMIALLSRHNTQSLHILKGKSQSSNTYGPDGSSKADLFKRSLISV